MSTRVKKLLLSSFFVSLVSGLLMAIYVLVPIDQPFYWAAFIPFPVAFMYGAVAKNIPSLTINALFGLVIGVLCYAICGIITPYLGIAASFGIATFVCTFIMFGITVALAGKGGICPMAFTGMIACFASGANDPVIFATVAISMFAGILCAFIINQLDSVVDKMFGSEEDPCPSDTSEIDA